MCYSTGRRQGFFSQFIDNIKQEYDKNKEMKENLKKFREEAEKLEQSDALKNARQKFYSVESEASKSSEVLKEKLGSVKDKLGDVMEEVGKTDIAKKASKMGEDLTKSAREVGETISEKNSRAGQESNVPKHLTSNGSGSRRNRQPGNPRKSLQSAEEAPETR